MSTATNCRPSQRSHTKPAARQVLCPPSNTVTPPRRPTLCPTRAATTTWYSAMTWSTLNTSTSSWALAHPMYDNDGNERAASYDYISESTFNAVSNGDTDWDYVETKSDFEALAEGSVESDKVFGLAQVETTLQQGRSGGEAGQLPGEIAFNDNVPDLATMSEGALNVLGQDDEGFHLMIEGGAIDWTGHANDTTRNIEETQDFNAAVESVVDWVEENSSWDETLLIVTADHETGYLGGAEDDPYFTEMTGNAGELPTVGWSSGDHTNHLVPYFFKGAGSDAIMNSTVGTDDVRGDYIDNVTVANLLKDELWAEDTNEEEQRGNGPAKPAVPANPNGPGEPATPATPAQGNGQGNGNPGNSNGKGNSNLPSLANENAHQNANKNAGN